MNCQEFDKQIQVFIDREIDYSCLDDFVEHYRHCRDCHEELEINFLMAYVLEDDSQTSFNLSRELDRYIQEELDKKEWFYRRNAFRCVLFFLSEGTAALAALYFLLFFI